MPWIFFAVLATFVWAIANIGDKYIISKLVKNPFVPAIIFGFVGMAAAVLVYIIQGFSELSFIHLIMALGAGVVAITGMILYFKAVKLEDISTIIPLFYLIPLFTMTLAAIFLGEVFTPVKYAGIFLLVAGAVLISMKNSFKLNIGKVFWLMISADILFAIQDIITKYLLEFYDVWTIFAYVRLGGGIAMAILLYFYLPDLIETIKKQKAKTWLIVLTESLNSVAVLFFTISISIGFVTLAQALGSIQPFFVLCFAVLLSTFYPEIIKEEIDKKTIGKKLIAIILMFAGAMLII